MKERQLFLAAWLCQLAIAQSPLVITVAVRTCPISSTSSRLTTVPTYSTLPYSASDSPTTLSSMHPPPYTSLASSTSTVQDVLSSSYGVSAPDQSLPSYAPSSLTSETTVSIPIPSYTSGDNLTSPEGNTYLYQRDAALSGTTIDSASSGMRKRQNRDQYRPLFDCLDECDDTPACVAVTLLGQSCLLFGAVERTTYLLGAQAAYNVQRFAGFEDLAPTTSTTMPSSAPSSRGSGIESSAPAYSTPYLSTPGAPSSMASSMPSVQSSSGSDAAPVMSSSIEASLSEVYSTPLISTDHGTTFAPPPPTTSVLSTALPVTLSIPSSLQPSTMRVRSSVEVPSSSFGATKSSVQGLPSSMLSIMSSLTSRVSSRSESPLVSATSSGALMSGISSPSSILQPSNSAMMPSDSMLPETLSGDIVGSSTMIQSSLPPSPGLLSSSATSTADSPTSSTMDQTETSSTEHSMSSQVLQESSTVSSIVPSPPTHESSSMPQDYFTPTATSISSSAPVPSSYPTATSSSSSSPIQTVSTARSSPSTPTLAVSNFLSRTLSSSSSSSSVLRSLTQSSTSTTSSLILRSSTSTTLPSSRATSSSSSSARTSSSSSSRPAVPSATPVRNTGKRGLCYTNDTLTNGYSLSGQNSQVSWGYNYYYQNNTSVDSAGINPALNFVPLLFNDDPKLLSVWPEYAQKAIDDGADSLLGFNEPDLCYPGSACMTVNQSVVAWRSHMEPFAGKARLGAPAVTNGGPPSSLQWLGEFMGNCTDCTIDFVPIHWYSSIYAFSYLQYYVQLAYNVTQKPIWVTEFGIDSSGGSEAQYQAFLQMALPWLDAVPYVERYAYFYNGPGYLINANGSGLSAQGMIYNSYTAPCPNWQNSEGHC